MPYILVGKLCTYLQGGKKLRERRFLACLERKYSEGEKLEAAYVSPHYL